MKIIKFYYVTSILVCMTCNSGGQSTDPSDDNQITSEPSDIIQLTTEERDGAAGATIPPPTPTVTEDKPEYIKRSFKEQQKLLVQMITRLNLAPSTDLKESSANMFKILRKCTDIFKKNIINELVLHKILDNAHIALRLLFESLDTSALEPAIFTDIMESLNKCETDGKQLKFTMSSCPLEIERVITEENGTTTFHKPIIPQSRKFLEMENDLIVEVNWKMFDFCHSRCYEHFQPQFNSHHHMSYEMEKFLEKNDIHNRWYRETGGINYLKGVITASNLLLRIKNLDFSVAAAHLNSKYKVWLSKPGYLKYSDFR